VNELVDALTAPGRLRICAFLSGCDEADFGAVQQYCELSKSNLSKQLTVLSDLGLISIRKVQVGATPRPGSVSAQKGKRHSPVIWRRCMRSPRPRPGCTGHDQQRAGRQWVDTQYGASPRLDPPHIQAVLTAGRGYAFDGVLASVGAGAQRRIDW